MIGKCVHIFDFHDFVHRMLSLGVDFEVCLILALAFIVFVCAGIIQERGVNIREVLATKNIAIRWAVWIIGILAIIIFGMYGPGFDASAFIYRGF